MARVLMSGNEAIAQGAFEAGVTFATGYPGTPSSEILVHCQAHGTIRCEWAPNEKAALEAGHGACLTGARALVTMKHVGLNVAADPLFTAAYTGVTGGLVILSADDPGLHSSQNEQDNRHYARAAKIPMLEPADSEEARAFTREAFALSEKFDVPVLLRVTTRISHSESIVQPHRPRTPQAGGTPEPNARKYVMVPANARVRHELLEPRLEKLAAWNETSGLNQVIEGSREVGIISAGVAYQYAREARPEASFLKLGMTHPLPTQLIRRFARRVRKLYVIEELDPYLATEIRALGVKVEPLKADTRLGELNPTRVAAALGRKAKGVEPVAGLPPRPPVLCPGCPHRGVFRELARAKAYVTGDIGCYTLSTLPPLAALHTCLCMGAGIGQAHGMIQAGADPSQVVAVIGDSTFVHSGITGLINMAYNRSAGTVIILDNGTTAMTGGQPHPGTGKTLAGEPSAQVDYEALARAVGIGRVRTENAYDLAALRAALKEEMAASEPSLIIARGPCIFLRSERGETRAISEEQCVGCHLCLKVGCPAIIGPTDPADKKGAPRIDPTLCAGCSICQQTCPHRAIGPVTGKVAPEI